MVVDNTNVNRAAVTLYMKAAITGKCGVDWDDAERGRGTYFRVSRQDQPTKTLRISEELLEDETPEQLIERIENTRAIEAMERDRFVKLTSNGVKNDPTA